MKIDRLIGILSILLQREKVTAPYLAEKFEVSRRTINRDIEDICKAGIPLVTSRGPGGGISIMEGYSMAIRVGIIGRNFVVDWMLAAMEQVPELRPEVRAAGSSEKGNPLGKSELHFST